MKTKLNLVAVGVAGILGVGVLNSRANLEVGVSFSIHANADFDVPLAMHGAWIQVGNYGRCWRPAHMALDWRPYCLGRWVWSDCGWYWESDEPWGWACYHYGRWGWEPSYGWIWIPGVEWAPAWVEWRIGGGYVGWAPLAPAHFTGAIGAPRFAFVQTTRFHERVQPSTVIVNNTTIIKNTTVINNVRQETRTIAGAGSQKVVVNEGPGVDLVQKATGKTVQPASVRQLADSAPVPAEVKAKHRESNVKDKAVTATPEQPKPGLDQKSSPAGPSGQPGKSAAPETEKNEKAKNQKPSSAPPAAAPKSPPERKPSPSERREQPRKPESPKPDQKNQQRPADRYAPPPGGPQPPAKPAPPDEQKDKAKGYDKNQKPSSAPPAEAPKSSPERNPSPSERQEQSRKPEPPKSDPEKQQPPADRYAPPPGGSPPPTQPPAQPAPPDEGKGKGKGHDKKQKPQEHGQENE